MSTTDTNTPPKRGRGRPAGFVMTEPHKAKISKALIQYNAVRRYEAAQNERASDV